MGFKTWALKTTSKGNITDKRQVLKILENYITELCRRPNRPENLDVGPEEVVDADEKGSCILQS
jgi:hypothetical protein